MSFSNASSALSLVHPTRHVNGSPAIPSFASKSPLRVGLLTDTFLPVSNGVTHMVAALAGSLVELGHEPHIFTFAPTSELRVSPEGLLEDPPHILRVPPREDAPYLPGVQVHYAPALPLLRTGYYFGVRYPLWMRNLLNEMDVLHVHHPFISGRLALRLRESSQPIVFTNHTRYDIYSHYLQEMMPRHVQPWVEPLLPPEVLARRLTLRAARFANLCDAVIAPSQSIAQVLEDWGVRSQLTVIPNGVDLSRFEGGRATTLSRSRWGISESAPLAIYVGRLAPEKNGRVLLESFASVLRSIPEARLLIVGDGPSKEEWIQWASEFGVESAVVFAGSLSSSEVPQVLQLANVFVSASVSEVHPLTFIEAMASGLPCVGTPSPGVCDMIRDGENGWLAPAEPTVFAQALSEALARSDEWHKRGKQARLDSGAYAIEATVSRVLELYHQVLRKRVVSA